VDSICHLIGGSSSIRGRPVVAALLFSPDHFHIDRNDGETHGG